MRRWVIVLWKFLKFAKGKLSKSKDTTESTKEKYNIKLTISVDKLGKSAMEVKYEPGHEMQMAEIIFSLSNGIYNDNIIESMYSSANSEQDIASIQKMESILEELQNKFVEQQLQQIGQKTWDQEVISPSQAYMRIRQGGKE